MRILNFIYILKFPRILVFSLSIQLLKIKDEIAYLWLYLYEINRYAYKMGV